MPVLNVSKDALADILMNLHPLMVNTGKIYNAYYYNHLALLNINSPFIRRNVVSKKKLRVERFSDCDVMVSKVSGIKVPKASKLLHEKNVVYDMNPVVKYLQRQPRLKSAPLNVKLSNYFTAINTIYKDMASLPGYVVSPIFVNLDEYYGNEDMEKYHFFTYLLLLLRRPQSFIDLQKASYQILFFTKKGYFLFDMRKDLIRENYNVVKRFLSKMKPMTPSNGSIEINPDEIVRQAIEKDVSLSVSKKLGFTGDSPEEDFEDDVDSYAEHVKTSEVESDAPELNEEPQIDENSKLVKKAASMMLADEDQTADDVISQIVDDDADDVADELKKDLDEIVRKRNISTGSKPVSARDKMLREKQREIKIKGKTVAELTKTKPIPQIKKTTASAPVLNNEMKEVKFANFDKTYDEELLESDIAKVFESMTSKTIGMSIIDVKVDNTSDILNMKETYTVTFEDEFRRRHTIKVNIPTTIEDGAFLYLNGAPKMIENQFTGLPVIKTASDTVQICTNYNKVFIQLFGNKFNPNIERFKKWINDPKNRAQVSKGDNVEENRKYITTLEYDNLAQIYSRITINDCTFIFNCTNLYESFAGTGFSAEELESTLDRQLIGFRKKGKVVEPLFYDTNNPDHVDIITTMMMQASPSDYDDFKKLSAGKKYIHTKSKLMSSYIPTIIVLSFFEGLTTVIKKFNDPNIQFTDKRSNQDNYMYIPFEDGYLQYPMSDTRACIMFNGLLEMNTVSRPVSDFDDRQAYIDIFEELIGDGYIAGGLVNFYDFMIDPITLEILQTLDYPTDIVSLFIYANDLLADSQFRSDIDLNMYRMRRNEIIPAILYKQLSIAYARYRATANNSNPKKMSVDPDCVIKAISALPTVSNHNDFGPMDEIKQRSLASMKGYAGMNLDDAYKVEKRAFDDSMIGIVGVSTDNAKNVGKERHLVLEPNIINARGMFQITDIDKVDELSEIKTETAIELLNPGGLLHDDPVRTAMSTKQRSHAIPVKDQSPMLVTTGMDATIQYRTTDTYSVAAKQDGVVEDYDKTMDLMTIRYKDGSVKVIDLFPKMAKNGGGGMYFVNKLTTTFKKGDKFKEGAILAFDKNYFKDNTFFGNRMTMGTLAKTCIMSNPATYEDSAFFTKQLSRRMSSEITMCKTITIGKNSNVDYVVNVGDPINVGDELIRFEASYDDDEMNKLLASIRDDLHEAIVSLGKTRITSKYEGRIEDIICYPAVPVEEMSPSLGKLVKKLQKNDIARNKYLDKLDPKRAGSAYRAGCLMTRPTGVVEPDQYGKIKGEDAEDAVLFEFYITYLDELSDGDKLVHMTANKATMGDMIPPNFEPFSTFRPYEEISILQPPSAILQRGTPSIRATMLHYKGLIELKRKQYEILTGESWNEKQRRENKYMDRSQYEDLTESFVPSPDVPDYLWDVLEAAFDFEVTEHNYYKAGRMYTPGDVVMTEVRGVNLDIRELSQRFMHTLEPNVQVENNVVVATDVIYPGMPFYI